MNDDQKYINLLLLDTLAVTLEFSCDTLFICNVKEEDLLESEIHGIRLHYSPVTGTSLLYISQPPKNLAYLILPKRLN